MAVAKVLAHKTLLVIFARAREYSTVKNALIAKEKGSRPVSFAMVPGRTIDRTVLLEDKGTRLVPKISPGPLRPPMIDSVTLPLSSFDLSAFIAAYRKFCRKWSGQASVAHLIVGMKRHGDMPTNFLEEDATDEEKAILDALTEDGLKVFFMMHEPTADERFLCIDRKKRDSDDLDINLEDGYGFLVEVEDNKISLHPALYDGSSCSIPQLTLQGTCSVVEGPMMEFINTFIPG